MTRHSRPRTVTIAIAVAGLVGALSTAPAAGARTHRASVRVHIPRTAVTSATSPAGCTSVSKADGGTWTCTFDEEFDGTGLDRSKWSPVATAQTGVMGGAACFVDSPDNVA